jgi:sarcosine oxidase subunit beta
MDRADVLVVGAGATGCAIAAHLLAFEPGLSVVLVDARHVGAGSTSRSMAAFRHQWSVPPHVAFSRYASEEYDRLARAGHPVQFRRNGYLFLHTDPRLFERAALRVERQRALGVEGVAVLSPDEIPRRVPGGGEIRLESLAGATWGPRDGFLDPLAVAQAYLEEARGRGARYHPDHEVDALEVEGGRAAGVRFTNGKRVRASKRVVSGGGGGGALARGVGLTLPLVPAKRYLYHSRPVRGRTVAAWPLLIGDRGAHFRPQEGNSLVFGWERRPDPLPEDPGSAALWEEQDAVDPGFGVGSEDYGFQIVEELARLVPVLAEEVALHRATCGWYEVTPDHKAILGEDPRLPGLFHATGFSGHGIMHAAASGLVIAELLLDRETTLLGREELAGQFGLAPLLAGLPREPVEEMVL